MHGNAQPQIEPALDGWQVRADQFATGLAVRLVRGDSSIGFWDQPVIAAGDTIVEVVRAP